MASREALYSCKCPERVDRLVMVECYYPAIDNRHSDRVRSLAMRPWMFRSDCSSDGPISSG